MRILFLLLVTLFVAASCKSVETPGGHVPAQYLAQAKRAAGNYTGTFEGVPTTLTVRFDGDRPRIDVRNAQNDLLGRGCGSTVGLLQSAELDEQDGAHYALRSATFAFSPGRCSVEGRTLELSFRDGGVIEADILQRTDVDFCAAIARDPGDIPDHCHTEFRHTYLSGSFRR
jgi:hypothetical protein